MPQVANYLGALLAAVLVVSASTKFFGGSGRQAAHRTALGKMLPERTFLLAWRALAATEIVLAVVLLWGRPALGGAAAATFFACAAVVAAVSLRVAPGASCGCLGLAAEISWRTIVRAGVLFAGAVLYARAAGTSFADTTAVAEAAATLALLLALSSAELKAAGSALRRLRPSPRCLAAAVPIEVALDVLRGTQMWAEHAPSLAADEPLDGWREGCWQFFSFDGLLDGVETTYAFALRLPPGRSICRAVLVNNETGHQQTTNDEHVRWPRRRAGRSLPLADSPLT